MAEYFAMGGYAGFIWPAYGVVTVVLVAVYVLSRRSLNAAEAKLNALDPGKNGEDKA